MPITELEARAIELIKSDPKAYRALQAEVDRLDPDGKVVPKAALGDIQLERRIEAAVAPIREENEKLQQRLATKDKIDYHESQRTIMRRPPYNLTEKAIDDLAEWMEKDSDGNIYKSYEAAHRYRMAMSQPISPGGSGAGSGRISQMTGRPVASEPWREGLDDPKHSLRGNKGSAKKWAKSEWQKAREEFANR